MATAVAYTWDSQRQGREIFPTWQIVIEKDRRVIFYFHLTQSGHYKKLGIVTKSLTSWNSCLLVDVLESLILAPQAEHRKGNADHIRFVRSVSLAYQSWDCIYLIFHKQELWTSKLLERQKLQSHHYEINSWAVIFTQRQWSIFQKTFC